MASVPIIVIVVITAIKDAVEDYRRTLLDLELNNTETHILSYWHNSNVTDDNVSLWRRFKKACSRLIMNTAKAIKHRKMKKAAARDPEIAAQFGSELTTSVTIKSVITIDSEHEMKNLSEPQAAPVRPLSTMSFAVNDDSNPFTETPSKGHVGSVMNMERQIPGKARFRRDYWKNVRVGDFIRIHNNDEIPADVVVIATSDSDGACYVETKNLDGETNLKIRHSLKCGEGIKHAEDCERATFWIESEQPHANLYSFNGVAQWPQYNSPLYDRHKGEDPPNGSEPISINNMLLRGCSLRNTEWVIAVVVYTGSNTKIMLNSGETPSKRSKISRELNFSVICNFVILFILCLISGIVNGIAFAKDNSSITYFEFGSIGGSAPVDGIVTFWAVLILYQSLVPISLYISIEIVKTIQAFFIYSDVYMYYAPLDYPCTPKSWNISDDLGQIEYVFSDKTGTLTQNVMEFKKCTINGVAYGKAYTEALAGMRKRNGIDVEAEGIQMAEEIKNDKEAMITHLRKLNDNPQMIDDEVTFISSEFVNDMEGAHGAEQQRANKHFMLALALCHSVISEPSKTYPGRVDYKAQSPDEAALVGAARDVGFSFIDRTTSGVILNIQGMEQEYKILNILEFNSTRKRMSAIIKFPGQKADGRDRILLICKGADSVIYSRLKPGDQELLCSETALHLEQFANEGLRTLCIAQRELSEEEYRKFSKDHDIASSALTDREDRMEEIASELETNLTLLGGTAIEDRLQDGVPQSIALLGRAGIKLWVLTGDKVETAINIGFSCNLLDNNMELLVLRSDENTVQAVDALLTEYLQKYFGMAGSEGELEMSKLDHSPPSSRHAVVIDGDTLKVCLTDELKTKFLLLCKQCKSVLCCRVSPAQKAAVVRLVKTSLSVMTLSIGDGANDVAMIQEADVGVGIAGEEGRAAVMSSDYAVGQFRFLTRLLLVHGRWSYMRLAEMIPNFFYKNVVFALTLFWYGVFSSFDGAYLFEYTFVMFFNLAFTSLPVILMGVLDQDVEDRISLAVPQLYQRGILGLEWSQAKFWKYMSDGFYQSLVSFFFPFFTYLGGVSISENGRQLDHRFWIGLSVCTIAVAACNLYTISNQQRWDVASLIVNVVSTLLVLIWAAIYSSFTASQELYKQATQMLNSASYWSVVLLGITVCMLPHYVLKSAQKIFKPTDVDIVREKWSRGDYDFLPAISEENSGLTAVTLLEKMDQGLDVSVSGDMSKPGTSSSEEESYINSKAKQERRSSKRMSVSGRTGSALGIWPRKPKDGKDLDLQDDEEDLVKPSFVPSERDEVGASYISFDTDRLYRDSVYNTPENDEYSNTIQTPGATAGTNANSRRRSSVRRLSQQHASPHADIRTSLEVARNRIRNEQAPPRESIDNIRMSMEIEDLTTAEGLMKVMSNTTEEARMSLDRTRR